MIDGLSPSTKKRSDEELSNSPNKKMKMEEPTKTRRGPWTAEEDELLTQLVKRFGTKKWAIIAELVPGRVGKQCRERWLNHLRTDVKKTAWTDEEDEILIRAQQELGNRWSAIARLLSGRPENSVKNRWNSLINKRKRCTAEDPDSANLSSDDQSSSEYTETPEKRHGGDLTNSMNLNSNEVDEVETNELSARDATNLPNSRFSAMGNGSSYMFKYEYPTAPMWGMFASQMMQPREGNMGMPVYPSALDASRCYPDAYPSPTAPYVTVARSPSNKDDSKGAAQGLLLLATLCT